MTTPAVNENDPSGFVTNPPSTIVKIQNTAREDMNGQLGIVVQFQRERGRYMIHLTQTQNAVSMKPENLVKGGYVDQAQAYYQQAAKDPQLQQMLTRVATYLPPGVQLKHAGIALGVGALALTYLLGFSRTMMLLSGVMIVMMVIGQDVLAGGDTNTIVRNAPMRFRTVVREQFPGAKYLIGKSYEDYVHMALAAFLMVFFVKSMMPVSPSSNVNAASTTNMNTAGAMPSRNLNNVVNPKMVEEYYKMGFDDATAEKDYGTSLPDLSSMDTGTSPNYDNYDLPDYPMPPPPNNSSGGMMGKLFSMSSAMSLMYLGRTALTLGQDANGSWSFGLFRANLVTMESWKLGMLGFSVYRLVAALMG